MGDNKNFVPRREAAARTGLCGLTLNRYVHSGKINFIRTPTGRYLYDISTLIPEVEEEEVEEATQCICYCRVSTNGQKDDLQRQIAYMSEKYPDHKIISDVGSGINFKRRGLRQIIDIALAGDLKQLVVAYKDRLCRIGYELVEYILQTYSNTEIIVDHEGEETLEQEISNDILQIINVYSAKINGMRSYSAKKNNK